MSGIADSLKRAFTTSTEEEQVDGGEDDQQSFFSDMKKYVNLTWKQRLIGFIICVFLAAVFALVGCGLGFVSGAAFAVLFTFGTICGLVSTFFLVGPISQAKKLIDRNNLIGTIIKIVCIVTVVITIALTFCAVFWWGVPGVALLFCIIEFVAVVV